MAHRPFTPAQQRQNAAFLAALRRTGNVRLACRALKVHRATYTKRRAKCAAFAASWDEALAAAHAAFQRAGGERLPAATPSSRPSGRGQGVGTLQGVGTSPGVGVSGPDAGRPEGLRTQGGEPMIVRQGNGRLQLRLAPPGRMTGAAASLFFETVAETANIRMAAAAAGFAHTSLLARARLHPGFARALGIQVRIGRDRVLWEMFNPDRARLEDWEIRILPMPKMSVDQAILQLHYHRPGGAFQRGDWRPRPLPVSFEKVAPRIRAKINAMQRAHWHRDTGRWTFPEEEEEEEEEAAGAAAAEAEEEEEEEEGAKPQRGSEAGVKRPQAGGTDGARRPAGPRSGT